MSDIYEPRPGLCMTRLVDGVKVNPSKMPEKTISRMNMLEKMNNRYLLLCGACDKAGLFELAKEYDALKMHTKANEIRREAMR